MKNTVASLSDRIETLSVAAKSGNLYTHEAVRVAVQDGAKPASAWGPAMRV